MLGLYKNWVGHYHDSFTSHKLIRFEKHISLYSSQVIDSKGHTLFRKEDVTKGKFAFTTEEYEVFDVCFLTHTNGKLWYS